MTRLTTHQRPINNRELPETPKHNRARSFTKDRMHHRVRSLLRLHRAVTSAYINDDLMYPLCVQSRPAASVQRCLMPQHSLDRMTRRSPYVRCSVRLVNRSKPWARVEHWTRMSPRDQRPVTPETTFSSLISSPLQMCQHHQVYNILCKCVSISQIFSKGLALNSPRHLILATMQS